MRWVDTSVHSCTFPVPADTCSSAYLLKCFGNFVLCRAGLYKQLAELKALVAEYREDPDKNAALKVHAPPT